MAKDVDVSTINQQLSKTERSLIFDGANKVEMFFSTIGANLSKIKTEDLIDLHAMIRKSTMSTWKLQAQIINELHSRSKYGEGGIDDVARVLGISRSQAYKDLAIWHTFFSDPDVEYAVDEKSYFQIALGAPDPVGALGYVEEQKQSGNYSYSTVDFKKYVAKAKKQRGESWKDRQLKMFMEIDKSGLIGEANKTIFNGAGYNIEMRYADIERTIPKQLIIKRVHN